MIEIANLLEAKERRTVQVLGIVLGAILVIFGILTVRQGSAARAAAAEMRAAESGLAQAERARATAEADRERWGWAVRDLAEMRKSWFYDPAKGFGDFRLDLESIWREAVVSATDVDYGTLDLVKDRLQKATATFRFVGNYPMLKRFAGIIERHPRLLHLEKIDFYNIGNQPGLFEFRITLAGYYARG